MRWTFDLQANAYYVHLAEGRPPLGQRELSGGVVVDLDDDGQVVGVELLAGGSAVALDELAGLGIDRAAINLIHALSTSSMPLGLGMQPAHWSSATGDDEAGSTETAEFELSASTIH